MLRLKLNIHNVCNAIQLKVFTATYITCESFTGIL